MKKVNILRLGTAVFIVVFFVCVVTYAKVVQEDIADKVLRFHVIANSNSEEDQNLKIAVRDRILEETEILFKNSSSAASSAAIARENMDLILSAARDEISKRGYSYEVFATVGEFPFPVKVYNDIMLPSGRYLAVRIVIGEGKGENWWCVMYPPMCSLDGITVKSGKNMLKAAMNDDEYAIISPKTPKAKLRFKLVDMINSVF